MDKQNIISIIFIAAVIFLVIFFGAKHNAESTNPNLYDDFAKCLTEKGAVMYGLYYCSHCQEQKATLGDSFKFIKYVECTENNQSCLDKGADAYPTWLIGTSTKIVGFEKDKTMKELSDATSCILPQ